MRAAREIDNHLADYRQKRGFAVAELAKAAGVSRQTVYAIEAGSYVPNTLLALKLARLLEASVEDLFALPGGEPAVEPKLETAAVIPGGEDPVPGQPVQLCRVDRHVFACAPSPVPWYLPASDGVVAHRPRASGKAGIQVFDAAADFRSRIVVAGCDPAISILSRHLQSAGVELVLAHRNSSQALELLRKGYIHVAGTHLRDEASGESNLPQIGRIFSKSAVAVISFADWEEGIVTARHNPKGIRGIEDLARPDLTLVNRERGSGSRKLLDAHLKRLGIGSQQVRGYDAEAGGHLPAAWQVRSGAADCCIATRAAARLFGLGFIPLVTERYDLVIRRQHLDLPGVQVLLETLGRAAFRREIEALGGYDSRTAGKRMA